MLLLPAEASAATATETFRDEFGTISYSGNDGTLSWATPWAEQGESGVPSSGGVRVVSDSRCVAGNCLRIGGDEVNINGRGAQRGADLSGAISATLTFSYRRRLLDDSGGSIALAVSGNGGSSWSNLATYNLNGSDSSTVPQSFDITPYMNSGTEIRFLGSGGDVESYFYADNVEISAHYPINTPPTFNQNLDNRTNPEGASISIDAAATDPDPLAYSATGLPPGVTINPDTGLVSGTVTYTASAASPYTVILTVDDGNGGTDTDSFTWTITHTNRAPQIDPVTDRTIDERSLLSTTVTATDPDTGDTLTFSLAGAPPGATIGPSTGVFTWTPTEAQGPGVYTFDVEVTDNGTPTLLDTDSLTVTVDEINQPPNLTSSGNQTHTEGNSVSLPVTATDPDAPPNTLTYSATGLPPGVSINPATGLISGTITDTASGASPYTVHVTVGDGNGGTDTDNLTWTITADGPKPPPPADANRPPTHPAGDPISSTIVTQPGSGNLTGTTPSLVYTPEPAAAGADSFTFTDGTETSSPATVTITTTATPPIKTNVVAHTTSLQRTAVTEITEPPPLNRTLVLMARATTTSLNIMGFPLILLGLLGGGMLTLGRVTLLPILRRGDTSTGTIRLYDPHLQYGLITPDDPGPDVYFHGAAVRPKRGTNLTTGDRIEYRATTDAHRDVAITVRLLPTTQETTTP